MRRNLTIALAGDVMLGRGVDAVIARRGHAYPWGDMLPVLWEAGLFLVNLECAITDRTTRGRDGGLKPFYFRAHPSAAGTLRVARVDFASLANNHACDYGAEGLLDTVRVLDRAGIRHGGAGSNLASAERPAVLTANDHRVAVVACADFPPQWAAGPDVPGIHYLPVPAEPPDFDRIARALAEARRHADLVILSIHWGPNMRDQPTLEFREFAHRMVGAGADIFWGHSAHVVQGVERLEGRLILYDTGDFLDDYAVDGVLRNDLSALFLVRIENHRITGLELVPVKIADCQVNRATGEERGRFIRAFTARCGELGTPVAEKPDRSLSIPLAQPPRAIRML